jgi:1-acyl-sn-glycerol-3-phosphate acyltransferase
MHLSLTDLSLLGLFLSSVSAIPTTRNNDKKNRATTYSECQKPKPQGKQLDGCPEGTLYVSQTDPQANYGSVSCGVVSVVIVVDALYGV